MKPHITCKTCIIDGWGNEELVYFIKYGGWRVATSSMEGVIQWIDYIIKSRPELT